jgi:hypothetical protein
MRYEETTTCTLCGAVVKAHYENGGVEMASHFKTHSVWDLLPLLKGWILLFCRKPWLLTYQFTKNQMIFWSNNMKEDDIVFYFDNPACKRKDTNA